MMKLKNATSLFLALMLMGAPVMAAPPVPAAGDPAAPACGQPGQPDCPQKGKRDEPKGPRGERPAGQGPDGKPGKGPEAPPSVPVPVPPTVPVVPPIAAPPALNSPAAAPEMRKSRDDSDRGDNSRGVPKKWSRGERVPEQYRDTRYFVPDWQQRNLPPPQRGYRWMCYERGNCVMVSISSGVVRRTMWADDRETNWRRRYSRSYTYNDDGFYRDCRERSDPAGILVGGIIGGLLGRAADNNRNGGTFAGIIIGGTIGAALTSRMDCDDRGYAYHAYYDALNDERPGRNYSWRNPGNNHRGVFRVTRYSYDADGFRCAAYSHTAYLDRRRVVNGRACRQPDGAWAFLN
jgi:Ni/Co efflux regulator RcnB/surface antigen